MAELLSLGHDDFYPLEFTNQATITHSYDIKENVSGLSPVSKQMAHFCADKNTTAWKVVEAQHWEAVGRDLQREPRSLAQRLSGTKDDADPAAFLKKLLCGAEMPRETFLLMQQ